MEEDEQAEAVCDWLSAGRLIPDAVSADMVRRDGCPSCGRSAQEHCEHVGV